MDSDVEVEELDTPPVAKRRGHPSCQVIDPGVSRAKFDREVDAFRRHEREHRRQGWLLLQAEFPKVLLVLAAPQLRPAAVLFGVAVDFTNYDVDPLSVRLVNPWTEELLHARELLSPLLRVVPAPVPAAASESKVDNLPIAAEAGDRLPAGTPEEVVAQEGPPERAPNAPLQLGRLMQWWTDENIPFLCMRGVREYHRHPAHTGDAWLLHRGRGEGSLAAMLSAIHDHGMAPIRDYVFTFGMEAKGVGPGGFVQKVTARIGGFLNVLPDGSVHTWPFA